MRSPRDNVQYLTRFSRRWEGCFFCTFIAHCALQFYAAAAPNQQYTIYMLTSLNRCLYTPRVINFGFMKPRSSSPRIALPHFSGPGGCGIGANRNCNMQRPIKNFHMNNWPGGMHGGGRQHGPRPSWQDRTVPKMIRLYFIYVCSNEVPGVWAKIGLLLVEL